MIGGIGIPELIVILVIVLIIFGAGKLPEIGAGLGKGIQNFKKASREGEEKEKEDQLITNNKNNHIKSIPLDHSEKIQDKKPE